MAAYIERTKVLRLPRVPLSASLDVTYRCNNNCRHCWIRLPADAQDKSRELTLDEISRLVADARRLGCRSWSISGGEPMLRPDFAEILDLIIRHSTSYTLNTNGSLITPDIARQLVVRGVKMVALYGATADVHDHVTRNPGSFEHTMRGIAYLKEAGAGFIVQIVPMRDNFHQYAEMVRLAESLSSHWRIGAAWLYLSARGNPDVNAEIRRQRLDAADVIALDKPDPSTESDTDPGCGRPLDDRLLAGCIAGRRDFHVDPYGGVSSCAFLQDPALRYDLRKGSLERAWEEFIPSIADKVRADAEYHENCGACEHRKDCRWCPSYAHLESGRYTSRVDYLCGVAQKAGEYKAAWRQTHRRFYRIAEITVQVEADEPITDDTFHPKFRAFQVDGPGEDTVRIRHRFGLPQMDMHSLGEEVYRRPPWAIYRRPDGWVYLGIAPSADDPTLHRVVFFNRDYTRGTMYNPGPREVDFSRGRHTSLTMFPSDQLLIAQLLADRQGCFVHASGAVMGGKGLLFVGHSEAGKSTMSRMVMPHGTILCDDRIIVRRKPEGFRIYGTWSHGELPDISPASAPLSAILFLEKSNENRLVRLEHDRAVYRRLLACLIKPFVTADWWDKMLPLLSKIAQEVPAYELYFDRTGQVIDLLKAL